MRFFAQLQRFIPAGAGNTLRFYFCERLHAVHPCRRREHPLTFHERLHPLGSSLQAQGTPITAGFFIVHHRFIPAGAGNTSCIPFWRPQHPVHPCRRREHFCIRSFKIPQNGSSLQAQGTQFTIYADNKSVRFIPAGAGNTAGHLSDSDKYAVHPCRRREHLRPSPDQAAVDGSSLQAQGTLLPCVPGFHDRRFIPAGAGNTLPTCSVSVIPAVHPCRRREHLS